jgi:hypothetical protein
MLNAYSVSYVPIAYEKRRGASKVRYIRDTLRATQIIVESIAIYNPLKLFILCSAAVIFIGIICLAIAWLWSVWYALLILLTGVSVVLIFSFGLLAVLIKFMFGKKI